MPLKTTLSRQHGWRLLFIAALCAVFGLWGIYDYVWAIPAKQRLAERYEVLSDIKAALETSQPPGEPTEETSTAIASIDAELTRMFQHELKELQTEAGGAEAMPPDPAAAAQKIKEQSSQALNNVLNSEEKQWFELLLFSRHALAQPRETGTLQGDSLKTYETVKDALDNIGTPSKPSKFDRAIQWAFILCLPFAPWFLWQYSNEKKRGYTLHDDGSLELPPPHGPWAAADIVDIDMSRWMRKSIATVVHRDGRRADLDDYKQKNTHLIVGAIASQKYPHEWTADAKPVRPAPGLEVQIEDSEVATREEAAAAREEEHWRG